MFMAALCQRRVNDGLDFFARKCRFGPDGVEEVLPTGPLSDYEQKAHDDMLDELMRAANKGVDFAHGK